MERDVTGRAAGANEPADLPRRLAAEALGSAFLLMIVVGSGIMGERLAQGNDAIALLANSTATGAGLAVLIAVLGPISGAHFNPIVSLLMAVRRELPAREVLPYLAAQVIGAVVGVILANFMFDLAPVELSSKTRTGMGQLLSEVVASAGLLSTIVIGLRHRPNAIPALVGCYIAAAYWFTASTAFANPAVTLARCLTSTFAGIRPADVLPFVLAQVAGLAVAAVLCRLLLTPAARDATREPKTTATTSQAATI